jgi:hypothetical protein
MGARAEVFISATTRELRSYREEVKNALLTLGIFPIKQTNFRLAHGPLTAQLRSRFTAGRWRSGKRPWARSTPPVNPESLEPSML